MIILLFNQILLRVDLIRRREKLFKNNEKREEELIKAIDLKKQKDKKRTNERVRLG